MQSPLNCRSVWDYDGNWYQWNFVEQEFLEEHSRRNPLSEEASNVSVRISLSFSLWRTINLSLILRDCITHCKLFVKEKLVRAEK